MSEESQRYTVEDETPGADDKPLPATTFEASNGTLFLWRAEDPKVEICVHVEDMPNPQQMASMQVPLADVLEFVAKSIVLPVRHKMLDQLSDVELLLGEVPGAAPPPEQEEPDPLVSREHNKIHIRRPGT